MLHTDTYENLNCVVSGRKEFVLFDAHFSAVIGPEHAAQSYYDLDVDRVDMTAYPGLTDLPWHLATVEAGDCLYVPFKWIHHVCNINMHLWMNVYCMVISLPTVITGRCTYLGASLMSGKVL